MMVARLPEQDPQRYNHEHVIPISEENTLSNDPSRFSFTCTGPR